MGAPLTRRQREVLDFVDQFIQDHRYAPSLEEIADNFGLSSLATVHKHIENLEEKGYVRREWNRSRALEVLPQHRPRAAAVHLPLLGRVAAGEPIEAIEDPETIAVPEEFVGRRRGEVYALLVRGDSMIDDHIRDGDYVVVESRDTAQNGEMVIALLNGENATLKRYFRERNRVRLQPANEKMKPIYVHPLDLEIQGVVVGVLRKY